MALMQMISAPTMRHSLALPIPLEGRYLAQLVVPIDITQAECDKLCAVLQTLVMPMPPASDVALLPP